MASFLELIDNTLGTHFAAPVYDPKAGRKKMIHVIDTAAKQHETGTTKAPNRSWKLGNNNAISFSPKLGGNPVLVKGQETNFVPAERFKEFLKGLREHVEAGKLDDAIKAALESVGLTKEKKASTGATRKTGPQSALNIGVAAKRRAASAPSFADIKKSYIEAGADPAMVEIAIKKRQAAEKEAAKA